MATTLWNIISTCLNSYYDIQLLLCFGVKIPNVYFTKKDVMLKIILWTNDLAQCFSYLTYRQNYLGNLVKMQIGEFWFSGLEGDLRFCICNELSGGANVAGPQTILGTARLQPASLSQGLYENCEFSELENWKPHPECNHASVCCPGKETGARICIQCWAEYECWLELKRGDGEGQEDFKKEPDWKCETQWVGEKNGSEKQWRVMGGRTQTRPI